MRLSISPRNHGHISRKISSGRYGSADDVLHAALAPLDEREAALDHELSGVREQVEKATAEADGRRVGLCRGGVRTATAAQRRPGNTRSVSRCSSRFTTISPKTTLRLPSDLSIDSRRIALGLRNIHMAPRNRRLAASLSAQPRVTYGVLSDLPLTRHPTDSYRCRTSAVFGPAHCSLVVPGTRYVIIYRPADDGVEILHVGAKTW